MQSNPSMSPEQLGDEMEHLKRALDDVRQLSATWWRQDPLGKADTHLVIRLSWHTFAIRREARSAFPELEALDDELLWSVILEGVVDAGEDAAAVKAAWDGPEAGSDQDAKPDLTTNSERPDRDTRSLEDAMESVRARSAMLWRQNPDKRTNGPLLLRLAWHSAAMYKDVRGAFPELATLDHDQIWSIVLQGVVDAGEDVVALEAALDRRLS